MHDCIATGQVGSGDISKVAGEKSVWQLDGLQVAAVEEHRVQPDYFVTLAPQDRNKNGADVAGVPGDENSQGRAPSFQIFHGALPLAHISFSSFHSRKVSMLRQNPS